MATVLSNLRGLEEGGELAQGCNSGLFCRN